MKLRMIFILSMIILLALPCCAGTSTSFVNTVEVFGGGGGDSSSSNYALHGKTRGTAYGIRIGASNRLGEGFINSAYPNASTSPIITNINPSGGKVNTTVSVTITGANFMTGATVWLVRSGYISVSAESVVVNNTGEIVCSFNLTGITTGNWDLEVRNLDGKTASVIGGFAVTTPSGRVEIIGHPIGFPSPFDPDKGPATIRYELNNDAPIAMYIYNISGTRIWSNDYPAGTNGGKTGINEILWDGFNAFSEDVPNGIYVYQIVTGGRTLATGKIAVFR